MSHWHEVSPRTWHHRENRQMVVRILKGKKTKYEVYHTHPGPRGFIPQKCEPAHTLEQAYKLVRVHLAHWNDETNWKNDKDYGKRN